MKNFVEIPKSHKEEKRNTLSRRDVTKYTDNTV